MGPEHCETFGLVQINEEARSQKYYLHHLARRNREALSVVLLEPLVAVCERESMSPPRRKRLDWRRTEAALVVLTAL